MKRASWVIGIATGLLSVLLQILHFELLIGERPVELVGLLIAFIFLGVGLWAGFQWVHYPPKKETGSETRSQLTARETEVLRLLAEGYSKQEIANLLFVSLNTIKTHTSSIYQKLRVKGRIQALQKANDLWNRHGHPKNHPKV